MPKFAAAVALFSVGFILAFLVLFVDDYAADTSELTDKSDSQVVLHGPASVEQEQEEQSTPAIARLLSTQRLVEVLSFSIDEGTLDSLQLIRSDSLRAIPSYRSVVLPELKRESLKAMLERFETSDWDNWPYAAFSTEEGPSTARRFVDDVAAVNPELGRFLETSAQLLYELNRSVEQGMAYDVELVLKRLIDDAETLTSIRRNGSVPVLDAYDLSVAEDPVFRVGLERKRCDLTVQYIDSRPDNIAQHLELIRGLQPRYCNANLAQKLSKILARLSLDGSRGFRSKVLFDDVLISVIEELSATHYSLKPVVANFYLVGALDAIEAGAYAKAESFVDASASFAPNLETQAALRRTIAKARHQPDFEQNRDYLKYYAGADVYRARMKREEVTPPAPQQKPAASSSLVASLAGMLPLLILVLVVAPLSLLVVYNRYVADTKSITDYTTESELELGESAIRHDAVAEPRPTLSS